MPHFPVVVPITLAILASTVAAFEYSDTTVDWNDPSIATLTDARCAEIKTESTSEVTCFLSFPDSVPNLFYEINPDSGTITIKLLNTKTGGIIEPGKIDSVYQGPVSKMIVRQEIQNKNETMKSLTPEWYPVVIVTMNLYPMIRRQEDIVVSEMENAITISFPWPDQLRERKKYYATVKKPRSKALIFSLVGVGTAGIGGGGYYYYKHYYRQPVAVQKPLEPVLPDHPSVP